MVNKIKALALLAGCVTLSLSYGISSAVAAGKHPFYLHARSDLRKAELLLSQGDESNVTAETKIAKEYVRKTIVEIDKAAVLDRKDVDDNPAIDTSLKHLDKFRAIYKLLRSAQKDISQEENNKSAVGLRNRALANINQAKSRVEAAASRDVVDDLRQDKY